MSRAIPTLLALLMVLSLPAMAVPATDQTQDPHASVEPIEAEETPNRLGLDGPVTTGYESTGPDLGASLMAADDELRVEQERHEIERAFENASSDQERADVINESVSRISDQVTALSETEEEIAEAHANGEVSDREVLQTILRTYNTAESVEETIDLVGEGSSPLSDEVDGDVEEVDNDWLTTYEGPLRTTLDQQISGDSGMTAADVRIETSENGYSIEMLHEDQYLTETKRFDNRDVEGTDQYGGAGGEAQDRVQELYPWMLENYDGISVVIDVDQQLYGVTDIDHAQGESIVTIDGATEEVYYESHDLDINSLPVSDSETHLDGSSFEVTVEETAANGPITVNVTDRTPDRPIEGASVTIDEDQVGQTDEDGVVWIVPPSQEYELVVEYGINEVNETIDPSQ